MSNPYVLTSLPLITVESPSSSLVKRRVKGPYNLDGVPSSARYVDGEINRLHNAIHKLADQKRKLKRRIKDMQRTVAFQTEGAFVILQQSDLKDAIRETFADNINAHGNTIKSSWIASFQKRFWGRVKNFAHNKKQTKNNSLIE